MVWAPQNSGIKVKQKLASSYHHHHPALSFKLFRKMKKLPHKRERKGKKLITESKF